LCQPSPLLALRAVRARELANASRVICALTAISARRAASASSIDGSASYASLTYRANRCCRSGGRLSALAQRVRAAMRARWMRCSGVRVFAAATGDAFRDRGRAWLRQRSRVPHAYKLARLGAGGRAGSHRIPIANPRRVRHLPPGDPDNHRGRSGPRVKIHPGNRCSPASQRASLGRPGPALGRGPGLLRERVVPTRLVGPLVVRGCLRVLVCGARP
jgi:hypothetical protein